MKQKLLSKLITNAVMISTVLGMTGLGVASTAYAGQITTATATLSVVTAGQNSTHTIVWGVASTTAVKGVRIQYRKDASATSNIPSGFLSTGAAKGAISINGGADDSSNWTAAFGSNADITFVKAAGTGSLVAGNTLSFIMTSIANNTISGTGANNCGGVNSASTDTCFIRITTYSSDTVLDNTTTIDSGTTTYTVMTPIVVSATVDPTLTFTITGVASGNNTNDANNGGTTSVTSTATTLPFGNVTVGTAKLAQQQLNIITNANNGYTVYTKFITAAGNIMTGTYAGNKIDPFIGASSDADWPGTGTGPKAWATPIGSVSNTNSAWLGLRSNTIGGFGSGTYAPAYNGAGSGKVVMTKATPDNGGTSSYVTFEIQANAYQPADSYTGSMVYNVVASY